VTEGNPVPHTAGLVLRRAALYDLLVWLFTRGHERAFREKIVRLARLKDGEAVLDVGCGTGTLTIAAKRRVGPTGTVCGVDASPEMLARARKKGVRAGVDVAFENAVAQKLPFADGQFDAVLASLMLHHLPGEAREQCIREIHRVLKPNGRLLAVDFGGPVQQRRGLMAHHHRHRNFDLADVTPLLAEAGFDRVETGAVELGDIHYLLAAPLGAGTQFPNIPAERDAGADQPLSGRSRALLLGLFGLIALFACHVELICGGL
jgi:ubiquinone/menaquinone biosynthesis C-methylase UbiE